MRPDSLLETVARKAIKTGIKLIVVAGGDGTILRYLPQLAEINTPQPMDVAGECLLYAGLIAVIIICTDHMTER